MERLTSLVRDPRVTGGAIVMAATLALTLVVAAGWWLAGGSDEAQPGLAGAGGTAPASPAADGLGTAATPSHQTEPEDDPAPGGGDQGQPGESERPDAGEPAGPTIETFEVVRQPRCPGGTTAEPVEGQPVTLRWRVTGADEVTISIDGPGVYATYPAEAGDTYSFGCEGVEGETQRHTYLLTAVAGESTVTRTLVVTATSHERTRV